MNRDPFISLGAARRRLSQFAGLSIEGVDFVLDRALVPVHGSIDAPVVLAEDVARFEAAAKEAPSASGRLPGVGWEVPLGRHLSLEAGDRGWDGIALSPGVHVLAQASRRGWVQRDIVRRPYIGGTTVCIGSLGAESAVAEQLERVARAEALERAPVARGTQLMGTKRKLASFLIEALMSSAGPDTQILDLMTGSGSAAAAFSQHWRTWASDAQRFSVLLAAVQGEGFTQSMAEDVFAEVSANARDNARRLEVWLGAALTAEAAAFSARSDAEARQAYTAFVSALPLYGSESVAGEWDPDQLVAERANDHCRLPYCLFSAYFANVFFGLQQAVEIDSLRYGIDALTDPEARTMALAGLVAAASDLSSGFGGHFAQPRSSPGEMGDAALRNLLARRRLSVVNEFEFRLLSIGEESEQLSRPIRTTAGPWQPALKAFSSEVDDGIVYFDPPYQRDEYSRYYHVLETLVTYDYPLAVGRGRIPDKRLGARFASEFSTRSHAALLAALANVIGAVIDEGFRCAWSYSREAALSTEDVIRAVMRRHPTCGVTSYGAPHHHRAHGGASGRRRALEYLVMFRP